MLSSECFPILHLTFLPSGQTVGADKSAVAAINRALRFGPQTSVGADKSAVAAINRALRFGPQTSVGADLSCPPPIYRLNGETILELFCQSALSAASDVTDKTMFVPELHTLSILVHTH